MTHTKEHGRVVTRSLKASTRIAPLLTRWPGIEQVVRLERTTKRNGKITTEVQYAITSLSRRQADAAKLLEVWRSHWGIENRLHWVRDTLWQEDRCRVKNPPQATTSPASETRPSTCSDSPRPPTSPTLSGKTLAA